jgi:geranylgeranyl diphosphate synthase type II
MKARLPQHRFYQSFKFLSLRQRDNQTPRLTLLPATNQNMYSPNELLSLYEKRFSTNNFNANPTNLYDPVKHIMGIKGKRIRPLLLLMSADMFGGNVEQGLNPSFAMEVFHNFTLVHDDIMDNADIRRGVPTVHKKFGLNAGLLAGDVMLAYAYKYLTDITPDFIPPVLEIFNKTAIEIFEGQQMDMDFEKRINVLETEYLKMIEFKTSVLMACSLQIGAIIAGAELKSQHAVYDFGLNLGLAFQIKDDYLDTFGDGEKVGKKIGGDILQNKKTYLLITALNKASGQQKEGLLALLEGGDGDKKIAAVKEIFEDLGVRTTTEVHIDKFFGQAITSLNRIGIPETRKEPLLKLAQMVYDRDF